MNCIQYQNLSSSSGQIFNLCCPYNASDNKTMLFMTTFRLERKKYLIWKKKNLSTIQSSIKEFFAMCVFVIMILPKRSLGFIFLQNIPTWCTILSFTHIWIYIHQMKPVSRNHLNIFFKISFFFKLHHQITSFLQDGLLSFPCNAA